MAEVIYYKGLTVECDSSIPHLTIEGREVDVDLNDGLYSSTELPNEKVKAFDELYRKIVNRSSEFLRREQARFKHLEKLNEGVDSWNRWRRLKPEIRPILYDVDFNGRDLSAINLSNAVLIQANLSRAVLCRANFHEANLGEAILCDADLTEANFCRTDLYRTDLTHANLTGANLKGTQLAGTIFNHATLRECNIYGLSAWDLKLEDAIQEKLAVLYSAKNAPHSGDQEIKQIEVDDLREAQLIYFLLEKENMRYVISSLTSKVVLILGRFTPEREEILDLMADELRKHNLLPIIFNFEKTSVRDFTETIKILAGLSRFVIADITNPKSSPLELQAVVPDYQIPFVPIIQKGERPFSMFGDLIGKYDWVLSPVLEYSSAGILRSAFNEAILDRAIERERAIKRSKELQNRGGAEVPKKPIEEYIKAG